MQALIFLCQVRNRSFRSLAHLSGLSSSTDSCLNACQPPGRLSTVCILPSVCILGPICSLQWIHGPSDGLKKSDHCREATLVEVPLQSAKLLTNPFGWKWTSSVLESFISPSSRLQPRSLSGIAWVFCKANGKKIFSSSEVWVVCTDLTAFGLHTPPRSRFSHSSWYRLA